MAEETSPESSPMPPVAQQVRGLLHPDNASKGVKAKKKQAAGHYATFLNKAVIDLTNEDFNFDNLQKFSEYLVSATSKTNKNELLKFNSADGYLSAIRSSCTLNSDDESNYTDLRKSLGKAYQGRCVDRKEALVDRAKPMNIRDLKEICEELFSVSMITYITNCFGSI
jgi:hypothetical protein